MDKKYDVVIAGAGVAGCLAARDLARLGHSVALIDRKGRDHLGHDWWDSIELGIFPEVGLPAPEPPELMIPTGFLTGYSPLETVNFPMPPKQGKSNIDRLHFAQRLLKYAEEAGATFFEKTAALRPIIENEKVVGLIARDADKNEFQIKSSLTFDTTGMSAALRKKTSDEYGYLKFISRSDMFVTHREILRNTDGNKNSSMVFGKDYGVWWIKRDQTGLVDVFAGAINLPDRPTSRESVNYMKTREKGIGREVIRGGYGAPIPVRRCFDSFVAPGLILCGDSACQCNPIDGSGMVSSLRAAKYAAETAHAALENNDFGVESLWPYNAAYIKTQGAKFAKLDMTQKLMVSIPMKKLEMLFSRGIISPALFWGTGESKPTNKLEMLLKLLRIIDQPSLLLYLVDAFKAVGEIEKHYQTYPEKYNSKDFQDWRNKTADLFGKIRKQ